MSDLLCVQHICIDLSQRVQGCSEVSGLVHTKTWYAYEQGTSLRFLRIQHSSQGAGYLKSLDKYEKSSHFSQNPKVKEEDVQGPIWLSIWWSSPTCLVSLAKFCFSVELQSFLVYSVFSFFLFWSAKRMRTHFNRLPSVIPEGGSLYSRKTFKMILSL